MNERELKRTPQSALQRNVRTMAEDNNLIVADNHDPNRKGSGQVKLQIVPAQTKPTLSHLPNRPAVDLAFNNLTYRVKEGRKSSEYHF